MLSGDGFRRVEFEGLVDLQTPTCSIRGQAEGLEISPELRDSLPNPLADEAPGVGRPARAGRLAISQTELRSRLRRQCAAEIRRFRAVGPRADRRPAVAPCPDRHPRQPSTSTTAATRSTISRPAAARPRLRMACRRSGFEPTSPLCAHGGGPPVGPGPGAAEHPAARSCKSNGTSICPPARWMPTCSSPSTARRGGRKWPCGV